MNNPHKLLGLEQGASQAELDAAFRRLAKSYHPDRNPEDPEATERFRQLRAAYEVLKSRFDEGSASRPDVSSTGGYSPLYDDSYRLHRRRPRRVRRPIERATIQAAIVLSVTMAALLILLYIIWANTQTDWIPGCCS